MMEQVSRRTQCVFCVVKAFLYCVFSAHFAHKATNVGGIQVLGATQETHHKSGTPFPCEPKQHPTGLPCGQNPSRCLNWASSDMKEPCSSPTWKAPCSDPPAPIFVLSLVSRIHRSRIMWSVSPPVTGQKMINNCNHHANKGTQTSRVQPHTVLVCPSGTWRFIWFRQTCSTPECQMILLIQLCNPVPQRDDGFSGPNPTLWGQPCSFALTLWGASACSRLWGELCCPSESLRAVRVLLVLSPGPTQVKFLLFRSYQQEGPQAEHYNWTKTRLSEFVLLMN